MSPSRSTRPQLPRRALISAATGTVLIAVGLLTAPPLRSQETGGIGDTGWWSANPAAAEKETGGFELVWAAERPQSTAAIDVVVPAGALAQTFLVLNEAGGFNQEMGVIEVCTTTSDWDPENPGAYADRPERECTDAPPQLGRDESALQWTGDITELLTAAEGGGTVGLALIAKGVPPAEGLPITTPFQIDISGAQLQVAGETVVSTTLPPETTTTFFDAGSGSGAFDPPAVGPGGFGTDPLPAPTTTLAPPTTEAAGSSGDDFVALGPVSGTERDTRPWGRVIPLTLGSLAVGYGAAVARRAGRARFAHDLIAGPT